MPLSVLALTRPLGGARCRCEAQSNLCFSPRQATGVVFTITGASDMTLQEVNAAAQAIYEMSDDDANIIFGAQIDETMGSVITVTVVATGFGK
ncbi:MAG: hypothetical protein SGPRY_000427 [Prymnesium sp.]